MPRKDSKKKGRNSAKEQARRDANEQRGQGGLTTLALPEGVSLFKMNEEGTYRFSILEYPVTVDHNPTVDKGCGAYYRRYFIHRNVGIREQMYVCPLATMNKPCPICEFIRAKKREGGISEEEEKALKSAEPKERQLFNIFDLKEKDKGIQILEMSYHNFGKQLNQELRGTEEDEGNDSVYDFADPGDNGRLLRVMMEESNMGGFRFSQAASIRFLDREDPIPEEIADSVVDLDRILKVLSYDELKALFEDEEPPQSEPKKDIPKEEEEEEDDEPPRRKRRPKPDPEPEPKPEPESEDNQDDNDQDDEDQEPDPPKRKRRSKPDSEDDDDQEPDPPKERKTKKENTLECPHGGTFGEDCETLTECEDCDLWEKCSTA